MVPGLEEHYLKSHPKLSPDLPQHSKARQTMVGWDHLPCTPTVPMEPSTLALVLFLILSQLQPQS